MKLSGCSKLARRPLTGYWFRAISLRFWATRLSSDHSRGISSRFSRPTRPHPGGRIVYLGATHQVAMHEVGALLGQPAAPISDPKESWAILSFEIIPHNIVNLSDPAQQRLIGTNLSELTGTWTNSAPAPTQELGKVLADLPNLEGFLYPSSLVDAQCLAIFSDQLHPDSSARFRNDITGRTETMR